MTLAVEIKAGLTPETSSATASGTDQHVITDTEVKSFGISTKPLKEAVAKYFGKSPNDAYLHSDTPWGDLYRTYGWPQVQTILVPESASIIGLETKPTIIATQTFTNKSSHKATFSAGIQQQVANTTSNTWSSTDTITIGQKFIYKVAFLGTGGGGETSFTYSHTWGESKTESLTITVGQQGGVSVPLDPGESAKAILTASRGVMKVRIVYKAYLIGCTAINYNPTWKDHHFWALDIAAVMAAARIQNLKRFTEDIEVGFYANSEIKTEDLNGNVTHTFSAAALPAA
jgi:hypothetical protein